MQPHQVPGQLALLAPPAPSLTTCTAALRCTPPCTPPRRCAAPPRSPIGRAAILAASSRRNGTPAASDSAAAAVANANGAATAGGISSSSRTSTALEEMPLYRELGPAPAAGRLLPGNSGFVEEHRIRGSETGPNQRATVLTIANLLQESGSNHGVTLWGRASRGFGTVPVLAERSMAFAATRIQIQVDAYPEWGDVVQVETWFTSPGRLTADRKWLLRDAVTGREFGRATSTWITLRMDTRRAVRAPPELRAILERFSPDEPRESVPPAEEKLKLPDLPELHERATTGPVQVARRSDMDPNGHINNVTYLGWMLETVPGELFEGGHLYQLEIDFKQECLAGDAVECRAVQVPRGELSYTDGGRTVVQYVHSLQRCDERGCVELARARTTWLL